MLKSAYELAAEKAGGVEPGKLSEEAKLALAAIDSDYRMKLQEMDFTFTSRLHEARTSGEDGAIELIESDWRETKRKLLAERDAKKNAVRHSQG